MARTQRINAADYYGSTNDYGYYQRTNLQTMIDNFMIAYIGADKTLANVPRHEVAFHMQRCVQEFNYDIFHSEKSLEFELGPALELVLPNDYVDYVSIKRISEDGLELALTPASRSSSPQAVLQDDDYTPLADNNGEILMGDGSETIDRWKDSTRIDNNITRDYFDINSDADFGDNYNTFYGRRFGLTPSDATTFGEFIIDSVAGIIYFNSVMQTGDFIVLNYITDGIGNNDDLSNVFVPKLAEDAVYANALYNLAKLRPSAAGAAGLYKKEAKAKMNNAKIRLMNLRPQELKNVLRNKSKWIKH